MDNKNENENPETLYKFDEELKPEITWDKICSQINKPRFNGEIRDSYFSYVREHLIGNRGKKRL